MVEKKTDKDMDNYLDHANWHFCKRCRAERDARWQRGLFTRIWKAIRNDD